MQSFVVVKTDVIYDVRDCFGDMCEGLKVHHLCLECVIERFHESIGSDSIDFALSEAC